MHLPASDPQHSVRGVLAVRACIRRPRWCRAATWWGRPPPLLLSRCSCFLTKQNGSTIQHEPQPHGVDSSESGGRNLSSASTLLTHAPQVTKTADFGLLPPSPCPSSSPSSVSISFSLSSPSGTPIMHRWAWYIIQRSRILLSFFFHWPSVLIGCFSLFYLPGYIFILLHYLFCYSLSLVQFLSW